MPHALSQVWSHQNVKSRWPTSVIMGPLSYILMKFSTFYTDLSIQKSPIVAVRSRSMVHSAHLLKGFVNFIPFPFTCIPQWALWGTLPVMATAVVKSHLMCDSFVGKLNVSLKTSSAFSTAGSSQRLTFSLWNRETKMAGVQRQVDTQAQAVSPPTNVALSTRRSGHILPLASTYQASQGILAVDISIVQSGAAFHYKVWAWQKKFKVWKVSRWPSLRLERSPMRELRLWLSDAAFTHMINCQLCFLNYALCNYNFLFLSLYQSNITLHHSLGVIYVFLSLLIHHFFS